MRTADLMLLARYNAWANRLMFEAVAALPEGEATRERPTIFGSMAHTLNHNLVIGLIWQAHLEARPHGFTARNTKAPPPLAELAAAQQALDDWYASHYAALRPEALDERLDIELIGGNRTVMTRGEVLLHYVNHCTYHRGYVADMFYQVPARPPVIDLPVYKREAGA